jgi:ELWxxDGT repeat protein
VTDEDRSLVLPAVDIGDVDSEWLRVVLEVRHGNVSVYDTVANLTFDPSTGGDSAGRVRGNAEAYTEFLGSRDAVRRALSALVYHPPPDWNTLFAEPDVLTITVTDGDDDSASGASFSVSDFVEVAVAPVNDPPAFDVSGAHFLYVYDGVETITRIDTVTLPEDAAAGVVVRDLVVRDVDAGEAYDATMELSLHCGHCSLHLETTDGLYFKYPGALPGTSTVVAEGSLAALNAAVRNLRLMPDRDFNGADELLLEVSDNGNTGPAHAGLYVAPSAGAPEVQCFAVMRNYTASGGPADGDGDGDGDGGDAKTWAQAHTAGGFPNATLTVTAPGSGAAELDSHASLLAVTALLRALFQPAFEGLAAAAVGLKCGYETVLLDAAWSDGKYEPGGQPACRPGRVPLYVTERVTHVEIERCVRFSPVFGNLPQLLVSSSSPDAGRVTVWTRQEGAAPLQSRAGGGSDGGGVAAVLFASEVVPIVVVPVNDAPTVIVPAGVLAVQEDQSKSFSVEIADVDTTQPYLTGAAGGPAASSSSSTTAAPTYRVALSATQGLLKVTAGEDALAGANAGAFDISTRTTDLHKQGDTSDMWADFVVVEGSLPVVNLALRNIVYQPRQNWNSDQGATSFASVSIRVDDLSYDGAAGSTRNLTTTAEVKFQLVSGVNDPPTITVPGMHTVRANCTTVDEASTPSECGELLAVDVVTGSEDLAVAIAGVSIDDPDVHETYGGSVEVSLRVSNGTLSVGREGLYFLISSFSSSSSSPPPSSGAELHFRCSLPRCNDALAALQYLPKANWFGMDLLVITVSDQGFTGAGGALFDNISVPLQILPLNDPPVCTVPAVNFRVEEDMNVALAGISVDDVDGLDGDVEMAVELVADRGTLSLPPLMEEHLQFTAGDFSTGSLQPGDISWRRFAKSVAFSGTLARVRDALAALQYVPDLNYNSGVNGTDKVSLRFVDSAGSRAACAVFVDVTAVNDAPFLSNPQAQLTGEVAPDGISLAIDGVSDFAVDENAQVKIQGTSLRDVDVSGPQAMGVTIGCDHGEVSLAPAAVQRLRFTQGDGVNDTYMAFEGHLDVVNEALGEITYTATSEFGDDDHVVVTVSDRGFSGAGGERTDALALPIRVYGRNDAPAILVPLHQDNSSLQEMGEEDTLLLEQSILYVPSSRDKSTRLTTGYELWRSEAFRPVEDFDSRKWRTTLVRDLREGTLASSPKYFTIYDNGGAATSSSVSPGADHSLREGLLYFQADASDDTGAEFWRTDGTEAGTVLVEDLYPGSHGSAPSGFTVFQDLLYFAADGVDNKWILTTDACGGVRPSAHASHAGEVVFVVSRDNVWQPENNYECPPGYYWASTQEGIDRFTVPESADDSVGAEYSYFGQCGWEGYVWEGRARRRFRFSDSHIFGSTKEAGTTDGHVIKTADFAVDEFAGVVCLQGSGTVCDRLYQTDNPLHAGRGGSCFHRAGRELWRSDGTVPGTVRVADIERGFASSNPTFLTPLPSVGGGGGGGAAPVMVFQATTREYGSELWRTDGTVLGTYVVADIFVGAPSSSPSYVTVLNGLALFAADDGWRGNELWVSDGTRSAAGRSTHVVRDINAGAAGSDPQHFAVVRTADMPALPSSSSSDECAFFSAATAAAGAELWVTDGTLSGTAMVRDIRPGALGSNPAYLVAHGGKVFFQADDGVFGPELWTSDGTAGGTRQLADIAPGSAGSRPSFLTLFAPFGRPQLRPSTSGIFFVANAGISSTSCLQSLRCRNSFELWVTDGTAAGTARAFEHSFKDFDLDPRSFENQRGVAMANYDGALLMSFNGLVDEALAYTTVDREPRRQSISVVDVDGDGGGGGSVEVHLYAAKGQLSLSLADNGAGALAFSEGDGTRDQSMTFRGTEDAVNDALTAVLYYALADQTGWDSVAITATDDSGASSQSSISVLIHPVNDAPYISAPSSLVAYPDVELSIFGTTVEDVDVDDTYAGKNGSLTMRVELEQGHLTLNSLLDLTFTLGDGVFDKELEFTGTKLNLNKAVFNLKYKCWTDDVDNGCTLGKDTIKFTVSDNGYSGSGGAQTAVTVIDISVQEDTTIDVSTYL